MKHLLAPVDFSKHSVNALAQAIRLATSAGAKLTVLHVIPPEGVEEIQDLVPIETDRILADAHARLDSLVVRKIPESERDFTPVTEVVIGTPFEDITETAARTGADLVVLGSRGESDRENQTGVVAAKCVRHTPAPILLVRSTAPAPFRRIVACVDFSDASANALRMAADIARQEEHAHLDIVHAYNPPWTHPTSVLYNLTQSASEEEKKRHRQKLQNQLDLFLSAHQDALAGVDSQATLIEKGSVAYAITAFLRESNADLAVLGTRGRGGLKTFFLGTTAERLVHHSPCSILAVKPDPQ